MEYISKTEQETIGFAKNIAKDFKGGEVIGLIGDLGAGKTMFSKGVAEGLGVKDNVNSPTFVLMKVYSIENNIHNIKNFVHIDAYRLENEDDLLSIGASDYFNDPESVVVIEWADKIKSILPDKIKCFVLKNKNNYRSIKF